MRVLMEKHPWRIVSIAPAPRRFHQHTGLADLLALHTKWSDACDRAANERDLNFAMMRLADIEAELSFRGQST